MLSTFIVFGLFFFFLLLGSNKRNFDSIKYLFSMMLPYFNYLHLFWLIFFLIKLIFFLSQFLCYSQVYKSVFLILLLISFLPYCVCVINFFFCFHSYSQIPFTYCVGLTSVLSSVKQSFFLYFLLRLIMSTYDRSNTCCPLLLLNEFTLSKIVFFNCQFNLCTLMYYR